MKTALLISLIIFLFYLVDKILFSAIKKQGARYPGIRFRKRTRGNLYTRILRVVIPKSIK